MASKLACSARQIGEQMLSRSARISLKPDEVSRLIACASTLIHGVVPQPQKILDAVAVLRRHGGSGDLEEALISLLQDPPVPPSRISSPE
ncbi:hypothetical protein [Pelomicrobium methylotrophicum]|uniref:Uncharacterized protein n=1 Tax=Pelomicrobium methylotrophicum TaxID=2602750 RepID=A0A5C7EIH1_9PROT|nr:hypothetical protein [Pelomicrobium methylotrophicum]TXF11180.1 hypothetical protein FR698_11740 [Pelomicrobium methylotrophicum]